MIRTPAAEIRERAERLLARLPEIRAGIVPGESLIGGGSTPEQSLDTWLIAIESGNAEALDQRLRSGEPPVIARIERDRLLLDLRTVFPEEETGLASALSRALA